MLKTIIIDDEAPARELLKHYLKDITDVELVAECADGFEGLKKISELKPDLVFLDIQMPKLTGFEMLEVLDERPFIIFTTAYDQYALKAFDLNAIDYLLKPFPRERLAEAVNRALLKRKEEAEADNTIDKLIGNRPGNSPSLNRIVVRKGNAINMIPIENVIYIEAQNDYVMVHYIGGKGLKQQTMKYYEDNLPFSDFVRIHRSYIVRVDQIKKLEPYAKENHLAILDSGDKLQVSKNGYKLLKERLGF
jgi:two-component system LytT family response regulator